MKDYDVCTYCIGLKEKDYCPCKNKYEIENEFVCDFYVTDYEKIEAEIRADERARVIKELKHKISQSAYNENIQMISMELLWDILSQMETN